jgi:hypothetical protein
MYYLYERNVEPNIELNVEPNSERKTNDDDIVDIESQLKT